MMSKKTKILAITAMLLNLFDVGSTLLILSNGGIEVNPLMAYAIEISPWFFVFIKVVLFAVAIFLLARHQSKYLNWIVYFYGALAVWHCYLLSKIYLYFGYLF